MFPADSTDKGILKLPRRSYVSVAFLVLAYLSTTYPTRKISVRRPHLIPANVAGVVRYGNGFCFECFMFHLLFSRGVAEKF